MAWRLLFTFTMSGIFHNVSLQQRALDYQLERHNVISSNIANVDTPGFRPLDIMRTDVTESGDEVTTGKAAATTSHQFGSKFADMVDANKSELLVREDRSVNPGADGNAVSLEREMAKMSANDLRYEGAAKIVASQLAGLKYAANDFSGGG